MSDLLRIAFEASPDPADVEALGRALTRYNTARGGPDGFERLFLSVRDEEGALRGGLVGATYWGWLFVDLLFVDDACRGRGVGTDLLARAEALAAERGATRVFLDTFSFQAEAFYTRHGYAVFGALDGFPAGHRRVWMSKTLAPS